MDATSAQGDRGAALEPDAARARAVRRIVVGELALTVQVADRRLEEPLALAFSGFTAVERPNARPVAVTVDLGASPRPGLPELPRLTPGDDGLLRDDSEGWTLTVSPATGAVEAHLRCWREDIALWRLQLEGLCRVVTATLAPTVGGALFHGAALVHPDGDRAVLFVGESGHGKTTMPRRLPGWQLLADDTVWVGRRPGGTFAVSGTPFAGKERLPRDGRAARLVAIASLAPSEPLALVPLAPGPAFAALMARVMGFAPGWSGTAALWDLLAELAAQLPVARLASRLEDDVAVVVSGWLGPAEAVCSKG